MPITTPSISEINKQLQQGILKIESLAIIALKEIGELCIAEAKANGNYRDFTGNLRRSIGYAVAKNGVILHLSDSNQQGRNYAASLAAKTTGITLIVVAGMEYAAEVEARGKDVLTSSELNAEITVPIIMKKLGFKIAA